MTVCLAAREEREVDRAPDGGIAVEFCNTRGVDAGLRSQQPLVIALTS